MATFLSYATQHTRGNNPTVVSTKATHFDEFSVGTVDAVDVSVGAGMNGMLPTCTVSGYMPKSFVDFSGVGLGDSFWPMNTIQGQALDHSPLTLPKGAIVDSVRFIPVDPAWPAPNPPQPPVPPSDLTNGWAEVWSVNDSGAKISQLTIWTIEQGVLLPESGSVIVSRNEGMVGGVALTEPPEVRIATFLTNTSGAGWKLQTDFKVTITYSLYNGV